MAFEREQPRTPLRIGDITVTLIDPDPAAPPVPDTPPAVRQARVVIEVVMSDGTGRTVRADIADHFSTTVLNQLKVFVASVRTKANAEILPE